MLRTLSSSCHAEYLLPNFFFIRLSNTTPNANLPLNVSTTALCAQYNGSIPPATTFTIQCAASQQAFLYVIVQSQNASTAICLTEVEVFSGEWLLPPALSLEHKSIVKK